MEKFSRCPQSQFMVHSFHSPAIPPMKTNQTKYIFSLILEIERVSEIWSPSVLQLTSNALIFCCFLALRTAFLGGPPDNFIYQIL